MDVPSYGVVSGAGDFLASMSGWAWLFCLLWLWRYGRLIVNCYGHWMYRSKPLPEEPRYTSEHVTVIIPTIHNAFEELRPSLQSILACKPAKLVMVTTHDKYENLEKLALSLNSPNIEVLSTPIANKRIQVCEALKSDHVRTPITVMADDDVEWPSTLMPWLLAPFQSDRIGGVGTCQRVKRVWSGPLSERIFNWLGAAYIERRNFEISATHYMDGGTSCMSGRTGAYRSEILKDPNFLEGFQTEKWGRYILNADDDNFVTRWLVSHGWDTWVQYEAECEVETTLENGPKFLKQCSRWARSNWRSNWTSLVREQYVFWRQPYSTYALHMATFTSLAFVTDPLVLYSCWRATEGYGPDVQRQVFWAQFIWMFAFTKVVKLVGLFRKNPSDIVFLPVSILFGWFHGFIKLHALFTINMTSWGSRPDGDLNDKMRLYTRPRRSHSLKTPPEPNDIIRYEQQRLMTLGQEVHEESEKSYEALAEEPAATN